MVILKFDLRDYNRQKQTMSVMIREERPEDIAGIDLVNRGAFETLEEAQLVKRLREAKAMTLSLVAVIERSTIVGHILFSPVLIRGERENYQAIGLAPMAVLPKFQRQGIGSALVQAGLERLRQRYGDRNRVGELPEEMRARPGQDMWNEPLAPSFVSNSERKLDCKPEFIPVVIVLGHPDYYPRFGFQKASTFGIRWEYDAPDEAFMALELCPNGLEGRGGVVHFHPEFGNG